MRSLFKRKSKQQSGGAHVKGGVRSTPPMITPIDPDGSTASHSSNGMYVDTPSAAGPMTASQFKTHSDEDMDARRQDADDNLNVRSRQGKNCQTKSREGVPIITSTGADHFSPSAVSSKGNFATEGFYSKSKKDYGGKERPKVRPSARTSAFGGAPRYDWMDIETTAAIKIQAAYRRLQTQNDLDRRNLSTPGMRNRRAQRQARYQSRMSRHISSADVPFPFSLCGVGLLFGDGTLEDEKIVESLEKKKMKKKKQAYEREDEEKRRFRMRKKDSQHLEEGIEVVESFDRDEEEEQAAPAGEQSRGSRKPSLRNFGKGAKGRGKSKRLSRNQNDFDPNEEDEEGQFL